MHLEGGGRRIEEKPEEDNVNVQEGNSDGWAVGRYSFTWLKGCLSCGRQKWPGSYVFHPVGGSVQVAVCLRLSTMVRGGKSLTKTAAEMVRLSSFAGSGSREEVR